MEKRRRIKMNTGFLLQMLSQRYRLPQNMDNPDDIVQHLVNSGQVSQNQLNRIMQMRNNPMIQQLFRK